MHLQRSYCINYVTSPTRPCTHVLKTEGVEGEVARLGTLRDSPLPRLQLASSQAGPGNRNLGAGAKLPRAALNVGVVGHMAAQSVRLANSKRFSLACVQSAGNLVWIKVIKTGAELPVGQQGVGGGGVWEDFHNLKSCWACMGEPT